LFRSPVFRWLLLVVVALAVAGYSTYELKGYLEKNRPQEQVLVAKKDIMPYTVITADDLGYITLPEGSKMQGAIQDPKQVIGKRAVVTIFRSEQILPQKLAEGLLLGQDEREVGVPTDLVRAVGMTVKPGDNVDVYWLPEAKNGLPTKDQPAIQQAQLIAENAVVVDAVNKNNTSVFSAAPAPQEERSRPNDGSAPAVVVLKVKSGDVQKIVTAIGNGTVYLSKRR
jgi:Flp pilus assembly protein CpaB